LKALNISPELAIPQDIVTSTVIVYGGKGMGKTNLGSVIIEELAKAGLRWSVLDPMGVFWGLRHSADGKGPGIECVILGGTHGDIPIEPTGGATVADLVIDESANTIIDFSRKANGKMWSKGEKIRFVTEYAIRLFERQGELVKGRRREPIFQLLDEAARYIPQQIPASSPMLAECVGAWETAAEEGRNIGMGVGFLTQRSARMNKSVSELADVMFAFRTVGPTRSARSSTGSASTSRRSASAKSPARCASSSRPGARRLARLAPRREDREDPPARDVRLERDAQARATATSRHRAAGQARSREVPRADDRYY
jgi:DNA helicase HerA-like ATPase